MFALVFDGIFTEPPRWVVIVTPVNQLAALALDASVVARANLPKRAAARAPVPAAIGG